MNVMFFILAVSEISKQTYIDHLDINSCVKYLLHVGDSKLPAIEGARVISIVGSLRSQTISVFNEQLGLVKIIFGELI